MRAVPLAYNPWLRYAKNNDGASIDPIPQLMGETNNSKRIVAHPDNLCRKMSNPAAKVL
jgi:hypothetical protein